MPRRNKQPRQSKTNSFGMVESTKKRFASKRAAENAIKEIQKYQIDLKLSAYQSPSDGGWYLTSK